MKLKTQPISFSMVDFMASFLPGGLWLVLTVTLNNLVSLGKSTDELTPLAAIREITDFLTPSSTYASLLHSVALAIAAFLTGYSINLVATSLSEKICFLDRCWKSRHGDTTREEYLFPYNVSFQSKHYFHRITSAVSLLTGEDWHILPGKQPYSTCKRFLRVKRPELWEEIEHLEADSRLIGSLFLASIFSTICALLAFSHPGPVSVPARWLIISIVTAMLLGQAFRKRRQREVRYTYLNYLIALGVNSGDLTSD